jgi:hypothetical protein
MTYVIISISVLTLAVFFMPKRLTLKENILIFATVGYMSWNADLLAGVLLNLFNLGPTPKVDPSDILLISFVPSLIAILSLNFMTNNIWAYVIGSSAFSFFYEWLTVYVGYMKNLGWKTWYSIPVYIVVFFLLKWYLNYIRMGTNNEPSGAIRINRGFNTLKLFRWKEKAK